MPQDLSQPWMNTAPKTRLPSATRYGYSAQFPQNAARKTPPAYLGHFNTWAAAGRQAAQQQAQQAQQQQQAQQPNWQLPGNWNLWQGNDPSAGGGMGGPVPQVGGAGMQQAGGGGNQQNQLGGQNTYTIPFPRTNPISPQQAMLAQQQVTGLVHNPAQQMFAGIPALQQMSGGGSLESALGLGQRQQRLAQDRNQQATQQWLTTQPIEAQLDRNILGGQVGVAHADLLRQMQDLRERWGLAGQNQNLMLSQAFFGGQ